jgi:hypothetical protein
MANGDLPIWPSGIARFEDGILEVTTGDGVRIAARDIEEISVKPPKRGRLRMQLAYRAGLDRVKTSYWVEAEHEPELNELVERVRAAAA